MSYIYRLNETAIADEDGKQYTVYGIDAVNGDFLISCVNLRDGIK